MTSEELARQRVIAWIIDALILLGLLILFQGLGWLVGGAYILFRDGCFEGQSPGKRIMGLKVVAHKDRLRCTFLDSAVRNVLWVIPVVNVVLGFTGLHDLVHDPRGRHWGDRLANTQVIKA
ncbi:MAG: RDD family protein [Candidatus Omnitrophica bacterium]|nr:RDD family protein [Candidatus Omnitrophota bacterium]